MLLVQLYEKLFHTGAPARPPSRSFFRRQLARQVTRQRTGCEHTQLPAFTHLGKVGDLADAVHMARHNVAAQSVVGAQGFFERGASIHCTETGRRFLLPANLPPLAATLDPAKPGWVFSPYDASQSFEIEPAEWEPGRLITCALTGHPLRLPAKLTDWKPEAEIASGPDGEVISPFAPDARITVPGTDWIPGKELRCPKTRKAFQLPPSLPPLVATSR